MTKDAINQRVFLTAIIIAWLFLGISPAQEPERLIDLRGHWRFEIGDDPAWSNPDFDDSNWESIFVPASWEDEGFPGYDGFAWYRRSFTLDQSIDPETTPVYLHLGYIDDVDEVFLNGHLVGFRGTFPPDITLAWNEYRRYRLPPNVLNQHGRNVICIRVYDYQLSGGILGGPVGIFQEKDNISLDVALAPRWKFRTGDEPHWKDPQTDDGNWESIFVPGNWEIQGYKGYDGFAWYRTWFSVPDRLQEERLILLLGYIDDLDEVFLNGQRIGGTGRLNRYPPRVDGDEWQELRAYYLPRELLDGGGKNLLAVRVYDGLVDGGIYDGPVGIVTRDKYRLWQEGRQKHDGFLWRLFEDFLKKP